jgi:hypothetical protein
MDPADERVLRILEGFERAPREVGPVTLSREYLDAVSRVETLPENRSGADKSWVGRSVENSRRMYARAVRKR